MGKIDEILENIIDEVLESVEIGGYEAAGADFPKAKQQILEAVLECLPKKKETKECEDCDSYYTMLEHGCACDEAMNNIGFNKAIQEMRERINGKD